MERTHKTLTEYLRHFIAEDQSNWDDWIPYATYVYNTTPHTATRFTPTELMFGRQANLPSPLRIRSPTSQYTYDDYVAEMKSRLQSSYQKARENLLGEKEKNKVQYDKRTSVELFKAGDRVLLFDESVRRGRSRKLSAQWIGPYVVEKVEGVNVVISRKRKLVKVHANRLKLFF